MPAGNGKRSLVQPGDKKQTTKAGLEIPVPKTEDFDRLLRKAATKRPAKPSRSAKGKR
jgi:hypothetical protein